MLEELADHGQALANQQTAAGGALTKIMAAHVVEPGARPNAPPGVLKIGQMAPRLASCDHLRVVVLLDGDTLNLADAKSGPRRVFLNASGRACFQSTVEFLLEDRQRCRHTIAVVAEAGNFCLTGPSPDGWLWSAGHHHQQTTVSTRDHCRTSVDTEIPLH